MYPIKGLEYHPTEKSGGVRFEERYQFKRHNPKLKVEMSIVPPMLATEDQGFIRIDSEATVSFYDETGRIVGEPFVITQRDIPGLDFNNLDLVEEVFDKYGDRFERLEQAGSASLAEEVFVDIIELRKKRSEVD